MGEPWGPGDEAPFPAMSPAGVEELTDDAQDKQNGLKQEGTDALEDGKKDLALEKFTAAIEVGCANAMLITRRAQLLFDMDRPRAAVNDCTAALAANPNSAKAFKIRAKSYLKLEMLEEAHSDFQTALKVDYDLIADDEKTFADSKEVAEKVKELQASKVKERVKEEQEEYNRKLQESKKAYEEGLKANEEKFREERMKEEEEKKAKEDERKERVRKREEAEGKTDDADESGVPKSHAPPEPGAGYEGGAPAAGGGAEDVD